MYTAHLDFECLDFFGGECVCLGNDWNDVDQIVELLHEFYVQWLQPGRGRERGGRRERGGEVREEEGAMEGRGRALTRGREG